MIMKKICAHVSFPFCPVMGPLMPYRERLLDGTRAVASGYDHPMDRVYLLSARRP